MRTNRELYLFVLGLPSRHAAISLERYLCALWSIGREHATAPALTLGELAALLEHAFTAPAGEPPQAELPDGDGFVGWQHCIVQQIHDLRAMAANGQLADEQRYFGIDSPRGVRWYNFEPPGYLECATIGTFGGWDGGDSRVEVPGKVAVLDASGALTSVDPGEIVELEVAIDSVDWDTFTEFLACGQYYE